MQYDCTIPATLGCLSSHACVQSNTHAHTHMHTYAMCMHSHANACIPHHFTSLVLHSMLGCRGQTSGVPQTHGRVRAWRGVLGRNASAFQAGAGRTELHVSGACCAAQESAAYYCVLCECCYFHLVHASISDKWHVCCSFSLYTSLV